MRLAVTLIPVQDQRRCTTCRAAYADARPANRLDARDGSIDLEACLRALICPACGVGFQARKRSAVRRRWLARQEPPPLERTPGAPTREQIQDWPWWDLELELGAVSGECRWRAGRIVVDGRRIDPADVLTHIRLEGP